MFVLRHFRTGNLLKTPDGEVSVFSSIPSVYEALIDNGIYTVELYE